MATGSSATAIEEVYQSIQNIVGEVCSVEKCAISEIKDPSVADLFVCGVPQVDYLLQMVPREKILLAEPRFTSQFFVKVARIPVDSEVYIFHSSLMRINLMMQGFHNLGITEVNFIPIAETMTKKEIIERLQQAKYIIGVNAFLNSMLGEGKQYQSYLRKDVNIIGGDRVSSMESACKIIEWVAEALHKLVAKQVTEITNKLNSSPTIAQDSKLSSIVNDFDEIMADSELMMLKLQEVVFKAFSSQISTEITMNNNVPVKSKKTLDIVDNNEVSKSLANIKGLSDNLSNIVNKLASVNR